MHDADRLDRVLPRPRASFASISRRVGAVAPVAGQELDREPQALGELAATASAKWPVSAISTRSPGDSVLTSAASQAPVPDAG